MIKLLPPPSIPREVPLKGWEEVEHRLGTTLPTDYKWFLERYGTGKVKEFLWVFNPFSKNKNINLVEQLCVRVGGLKYLSEKFPHQYPYSLFPQPGGLFPFAGTDNGDTIYWITEGEPNEWRVAVNDARSPMFEEFKCGAVAFLYGILTQRIVSRVLPRDFAVSAAGFKSISAFPE